MGTTKEFPSSICQALITYENRAVYQPLSKDLPLSNTNFGFGLTLAGRDSIRNISQSLRVSYNNLNLNFLKTVLVFLFIFKWQLPNTTFHSKMTLFKRLLCILTLQTPAWCTASATNCTKVNKLYHLKGWFWTLPTEGKILLELLTWVLLN